MNMETVFETLEMVTQSAIGIGIGIVLWSLGKRIAEKLD